jgi:ATP-binding cassette, subfamily B, bacterial
MPDDAPALLRPVARPMARLFSYLAPVRGRLAVAVGASVVNKVLDLAPPFLVGWLVDVCADKTPGWIASLAGDGMERRIVFMAILTVVVFVLESLFQWAYQLGFLNLAQDVQHRLRLDAYRAMQDRELEFFEEHRVGRTLAMLNDDVNQLERFLNTGFNEIVQLVVLVLFATWSVVNVSWELALVGMAPIPLLVWGSVRFSKALQPRYADVRRAVGDVASRLENNIAGILVVKSFTAEEYEAGRVEAESDAYRQANRRAIRLSAAFTPIIRMGVALGFAGGLAYGGAQVVQGAITPGDIVMFGMMIQRLLWPLARLGDTLDSYQRGRASAAKVFSLVDTPSAVVDPSSPKALGKVRGEVRFDDVRFVYSRGEAVLSGLTFRVAPGEMVGIAGPTGAGKSTIVKLLLRLYDVAGGAIRIDGVDVRDVAQRDLRRHVALVSQDVYLFHGTVRENIAYGYAERDAPSDERVVDAAKRAQLHDFIATLPEGYDTLVGERGIKLSGGQRQRMSIARAILKDAPILVLDEATSSVDTETERQIQQSLALLAKGRTAIVIAHRLSTIRHADRILVLRDGVVVEEGHHDDLVAAGGTYADLWNVQSGQVVAG